MHYIQQPLYCFLRADTAKFVSQKTAGQGEGSEKKLAEKIKRAVLAYENGDEVDLMVSESEGMLSIAAGDSPKNAAVKSPSSAETKKPYNSLLWLISYSAIVLIICVTGLIIRKWRDINQKIFVGILTH